MDLTRERFLRNEMRPFLVRHDVIAFVAVIIDLCVYVGATALAIIVEPVWQRQSLSVVAGTMISLFVLGLTCCAWRSGRRAMAESNTRQNSFFPLHNYSLWVVQHSQLSSNNVKGCNSWAPLSNCPSTMRCGHGGKLWARLSWGRIRPPHYLSSAGGRTSSFPLVMYAKCVRPPG